MSGAKMRMRDAFLQAVLDPAIPVAQVKAASITRPTNQAKSTLPLLLSKRVIRSRI